MTLPLVSLKPVRSRQCLKERAERYGARPRGRIGKMLWIEVWFMPGGGVGV